MVGIVPASDTGAVEIALWSLLGPRPVDVIAFESFGLGWKKDIETELKLSDVRAITAGYGDIPDLSGVRADADVVFTWNGTTSGVRMPNGDWIADDRAGLTICDATSAAFSMALRRGPTRGHDTIAPRRRAIRDPYAGLADAENFPPDQGWKGQSGDIRGVHHQYPVDVVC